MVYIGEKAILRLEKQRHKQAVRVGHLFIIADKATSLWALDYAWSRNMR